MARASNPAGTTAMWVRDRLDGLWDDEDFAGWYLGHVPDRLRLDVRGLLLPGLVRPVAVVMGHGLAEH
jgi:hypothetical protein